jgi:fucose 4-O-acetylase-like acetyltransferase
MARLTIVFGFLLIVVAVIGFVATGHAHPTALIPGGFGLLLVLCGTLANSSDDKRRMLWMHIAVTLGLLGFLATAKAIFQTVEIFQGMALPHPPAIEEKAAMSAVCLVFTLLCVRSFITARRARKA